MVKTRSGLETNQAENTWNLPPNTTGECDLCGNEEELVNQCCSVKVCFPCDCRFAGRCAVCQRDELNEEVFCEGEGCENVGTSMTILYCPYCDGFFCPDCLDGKEPWDVCCTKLSCAEKWIEELAKHGTDEQKQVIQEEIIRHHKEAFEQWFQEGLRRLREEERQTNQ